MRLRFMIVNQVICPLPSGIREFRLLFIVLVRMDNCTGTNAKEQYG